jgi:hypothetical protein
MGRNRPKTLADGTVLYTCGTTFRRLDFSRCSIDSDPGYLGTAAGAESGSAGGSADYEAGASVGGAGAGHGPGLESVGLVDGADRLAAEVEAAAAGAPSVDPLTGQPALDPALANPNGQWSAITPPTVEVLCAVVLPAWQIQPAERTPVAEALAECLEQVFPGGIEGKYACWVRLLVACGAITVSRVATNNGRLPPLFVQKASKPAPAAPRDPATITSLTE